jgi:hypothetical protein
MQHVFPARKREHTIAAIDQSARRFKLSDIGKHGVFKQLDPEYVHFLQFWEDRNMSTNLTQFFRKQRQARASFVLHFQDNNAKESLIKKL